MNMMNANKLMALLGLEYPTTSRYKELHAAVTQALEVARVEGATDCCMAYDCERLKPQPAEPVQKLRPDFIAGYDAGMKDMMRRVKTEIAEQPLPEPQPEASELRICARRVLIAWDGTVLPKSRDSLMQERMEDLRVALDFEEPSPSKKLLAAGFTPRDRRLECDECGAKVTPQMMPLHECEQPEAVPPTAPLPEPDFTLDGDTLACYYAETVTRLLAAAQPQPEAAKKVCRGIPRAGCNYLAECDTVCNKCGRIHNGYANPNGTITTRGHTAPLAAGGTQGYDAAGHAAAYPGY